jgi:glycosyltransferase involved in cell wall biosynthesis
MREEVKIALMAKYFLSWGGGIDFFRNCTNALLIKRKKHAMEISILFPERTSKGRMIDFLYPYKKLADELLSFRIPHYYKTRPIAKENLLDALDRKNNELSAMNYRDNRSGLLACLQKIQADIIFPLANSPGERFAFRWLGYIPDLQHKNLSHFFTRKECTVRDRIYGDLLRDAKAVVVNSRSVKSDIENYYPDFQCRIFPLPFAPIPFHGWFEDDPSEYRRKYCLPDRYFMISNQFWIHKSHMTAFKALYDLRRSSPLSDIHIVCTGETGDYRFPKYFKELKSWIDEMNLSAYIHVLGYIPKKDQLQILRGAIALLQPTLFEGGPGGGAVYDSVALGVPSIVSDIPVNKEIDEDNVFFFRAGSSDDLKDKMLELSKRGGIRPSKEALIERGRQRAENLGNALCEAMDYVVSLPLESPRGVNSSR